MTLLHQAAQKAVEAKQREAFEHWYSDAGRWPKSVARGEDGHYLLAQTNSSYEAWRAALSALQQQLEPVAPTFASAVARRKWESLQADGYRMQHIHFARSMDGHERRGTIDPWGKVLWGQEIAPPALQHQEVPREPVADLLRGLVNHWNEFGPEHGLDEMMDAAHRYLAASPSTTRQQEAPDQSYGGSVGYKVAMCVLQSELYHHLDDDERADCDELIRRGQAATRQQEVGIFDKTGERINAMAKEAGFHMEPMTNMLYTVRGNHAQLVNFARLVLAAAPSTPEKAGGVATPAVGDLDRAWGNLPLAIQAHPGVKALYRIASAAALGVKEVPESRRERLIANGYKTDSRCKWLAIGRCAECGREHDGGVPASVSHPLPAQANDGGEHG